MIVLTGLASPSRKQNDSRKSSEVATLVSKNTTASIANGRAEVQTRAPLRHPALSVSGDHFKSERRSAEVIFAEYG